MHQDQSLATNPIQAVGFCRANEAAKALGVSKSTFWLWVSNESLNGISTPKPIKLSAGITVFKRCDIYAFIEQLAAQADSSQPLPRKGVAAK